MAEADESDRSFLRLMARMTVVTNIDYEHLERYDGFDDLTEAFVAFASKAPFYGAAVLCIDDEHVRAMAPRVTSPVVTYGDRPGRRRARRARRAARPRMAAARPSCGAAPPAANERAGHARTLRGRPAGTTCRTRSPPSRWRLELGVPFETIAAALADFEGAERRFERKGAAAGVEVFDDYGHHPTEIAAVLRAARTGRSGRLIVAFQPHRYSRTRQLRDEFGPALALADEIVLTGIYAAGEDPMPGRDDRVARRRGHRCGAGPRRTSCPTSRTCPRPWRDLARAGDLVITMGAGIDRRLRRPHPRGAAAMRVAAPADKRFRRAHVRPPRRRHSWARVLGIRAQRGGARRARAPGCTCSQQQVAQARALHVDRIAVRGNERLSTGEVLVLLDGLRGQHLLAVDLDRWQRRLLSSPWVGHAVAAARAAVHGGSPRSMSGSRWPSAGSAPTCT